jgi:hypothetical protein
MVALTKGTRSWFAKDAAPPNDRVEVNTFGYLPFGNLRFLL